MNARTWMSRGLTAGLLALACCGAGCVTTETTVFRPKNAAQEVIPAGPVHQVQAAWENRTMVTQDVVNNEAAPLIGLAGRLYLFGTEVGFPLQGDGMAIVELRDLTKADPQNSPQVLERWIINRDDLKRLLRKDTIGWGYTLFLPWGTYSPERTRLQLQVRYVPEKGLPLFSPPSVVTLHNDAANANNIQTTVTQRQVPPGSVAPTMYIAPPPAPPQATQP